MNAPCHALDCRQQTWMARGSRRCTFPALALVACLLFALPPNVSGATRGADSQASASTSREALLFRNGDLLYGSLESVRPETGVRWRHPDVEDVIEFAPDNIAEVHFPPRPRVPVSSPNACRLHLSNGDEMDGNIVLFDGDKAVLETWYAGEVTVARKMIQSIIPVLPEGAVVYEGPTGVEGWTIGKVVSAIGDAGEWKYRNGAFYATNAASIARNINMPDMARIEFDLAWKGVFQLALAIYTDYMQPINLANKDTEPEFAGFYSLQLNSFSANLLPVKKNDPIRYLGQVSVPAFNQKNAAHVEIRSSKPARSVALYVDGRLIKLWTDSEEFAGEGKGVRFVHQGQGRIRLSNLRVSEWNGQSEEKQLGVPDVKQDTARLRNGDKVAGDVQSIEDGKMLVAIGGSHLTVPLSRIKQIDFASQKIDRTTDESSNVRAVFTRGGSVSFQLVEWKRGRLVGTSPNFGQLAFDSAAFIKVELELRLP
ncbi:MAG: hypothetical protein AB9869_17310 [Verrucomicrobiia bacterium]